MKPIYVLTLLFLLVSIPVFADEYVTLTGLDRYTYSNGQYSRPCALNGYCEFTLNITKNANATNHTIAFSVHEQNVTNSSHWYYVPFEQYVSSFTIYKNVTTVNGNGSITTTWTAIDDTQSKADLDSLGVGAITQRKYTFYANHTVDLIPTYFITASEYRTYPEYVVFVASDSNGDFFMYLPFDTSATTPADNEAPNADGTWDIQGSVTFPTVNGVSIGGSTQHLSHYDNASEPIREGLTLDPSMQWVNNSASFSLLGKNWNCEHPTVCFVSIISDNCPFMQWYYYANQSIALGLRDGDCSDEVSAIIGYVDMSQDVWNLLSLSLFDEGSGNIRVQLFLNGTVLYNTVWAGYDNGIFPNMVSCNTDDGGCTYGGYHSGNFNINGFFDEFRIYSGSRDTNEYVSLYNAYFFPSNAPTFNQIYQNTTQPNGTFAFTGNWSASNEALGTANDTRWSVVTNNGTQETTNTWNAPGYSGVVYTTWSITNGDGTAYQTTIHTFTQTNVTPFFEQYLQNSSLLNGSYTYTLNWTATNNASVAVNDSRWTSITDNGTQTATVTWNNPTVLGAVFTTFTVTNADGSDMFYNQYFYFSNNASPYFTVTPAGDTLTTNVSETYVYYWNATNDALATSNDSRVTVATYNTTRTINATALFTTPGTYYVRYTITNGDGFVNADVTYTVSNPVAPVGDDPCDQSTSTGRFVCDTMNGVGNGINAILTAVNEYALELVMFIGIGLAAISVFSGSFASSLRSGLGRAGKGKGKH